jgi:hypothetical protein
MKQIEMLEMLYALDAELMGPLTIVITGASALIIRGNVSRTSNDIDILKSSEDLDHGYIKECIERIAVRKKLNRDWIDTRPVKETFKDLPGYIPDLEELIPDRKFKNLRPFIISKADSVITKLARFQNIRSWDIGDIRETAFSDKDYIRITEKLRELTRTDPERALRIEIAFKGIKKDFIKTEDGFSFSSSNEVAEYGKKRYGIILEKEYLMQIDRDAADMTSSYEKAIIDIDKMALDRIIKERNHEHGMEI